MPGPHGSSGNQEANRSPWPGRRSQDQDLSQSALESLWELVFEQPNDPFRVAVTNPAQPRTPSGAGGGGGSPGGGGAGLPGSSGSSAVTGGDTIAGSGIPSGGGMDWYKLAQLASTYLANRQKSKADAGLTMAQLQGMRDTSYNQNQISSAQLDLLRRRFQNEAPEIQARQAARGDVQKNVQDVQIHASPRVQGHIPQITGGLRPSLLEAGGGRKAGELLTKSALSRMEGGNDFAPLNLRESAYPNIGGGGWQDALTNMLGLLSLYGQVKG